MDRKASAVWEGGLKDGKGSVSTESGVLSESQYSFSTRFEEGDGTNPEELIAAAHAGCFSMALSMILGESDIVPESIATTATVAIQPCDDGFEIPTIHLDVTARIADADEDAFLAAAEAAKDGCPISKLMNAEITMDARLEE